MKKFLVNDNIKNKLFEVFYHSKSGELEGTASVKVVAKDIIEAIEVLIALEKIDISEVEYVSECKCERIIA